MAGPTIVAATVRLVELIQFHELAPAEGVMYELGNPDTAGQQIVYVAEWRPGDVTDAALKVDRRRRQEVYDIVVCCEATVLGGTQRDADEAALDLLTAVHETVADNPTLSGAVLGDDQQIVSAVVAGWELDGRGPADVAGFYCRFLTPIRVTARTL